MVRLSFLIAVVTVPDGTVPTRARAVEVLIDVSPRLPVAGCLAYRSSDEAHRIRRRRRVRVQRRLVPRLTAARGILAADQVAARLVVAVRRSVRLAARSGRLVAAGRTQRDVFGNRLVTFGAESHNLSIIRVDPYLMCTNQSSGEIEIACEKFTFILEQESSSGMDNLLS